MDGTVSGTVSTSYSRAAESTGGDSSCVVQRGGGLGAIDPYTVLSWGSRWRPSKRLLYLAKKGKIQTIFKEKLKLRNI